ncbi:hypothetical protein Phou_091310 [Phytohabitans houttuyneae]|uniref:Type IV secretion system coupling protein TraD DNA-binding domain-containing protein n=1 Tax=Phytohabitans houttuyneae TaxID=1076126 RepID=A0A6V8KRH3_9ACTN|nr:hypothetical protein Phou_091310 [Phytohabitans houttuyneae]
MNDINHRAARAGSRPAGRLNLVPLDERYGLGGKVIGVANAGPQVRVGISLADCRYHLHVLGPTGTGKTTLLMRMVLDDVDAGRGVAAFDPAKGDLIRDLLARLPKSCGDRLVLIDPDERKAPPAINLLDPAVHGGSAHDVAANLTAVMAKVWHRWWGTAPPTSATTACSPSPTSKAPPSPNYPGCCPTRHGGPPASTPSPAR